LIRPAVAALLLAGGLLLAPDAAAHSPFPGIKGLYTGFLHPLTQPAQAMLLIAAGLLLASRPDAAAALVGAAGIGLIAADLAAPRDYAPLLTTLVIGAGLPVLLQRRVPGWLGVGLTGAAGGALGLACAPDPGSWQDVAITSFGSWLGVMYFAAMITGALVTAWRRWPGPAMQVGVRIVAAWLIAIAVIYTTLIYAESGMPWSTTSSASSPST